MKSQGKGTPDGAVAFARHLQKKYWPTLTWEKSNSGNGLGCPILIKKDGHCAAEVNVMLRKLDRWLKNEAARIGADIENVEVKGTLPIVEYKRGKPTSIRYGSFARYPRRLSAEQLSNSPILGCDDWLLMKIPEPAKDKPKNALNVGSVSGQLVSNEELAAIPKYERLYRRLVGPDLKANARFSVTPHDFAVACVLLRFFKSNPNKDGTMPTSRIRALWHELHAKGQVQRPFNDRRWKRIRDWLSENGHIDWQDERFQAPNPKLGLKPIACKFSITDEFFDVLDSIKLDKREASFIDTVEVKQGPGKWLSPRLFPIQREMEAQFWFDADERVDLLLAA